MEQRTIQILFALLRCAICGTKLTEAERNDYSPEQLSALFKISSKHDLAHLLAVGLKQNGLVSKESDNLEKYIRKAVFRYERTRCDYEKLCEVLERAQIPFLPLKGSVIRKYYPEAWMRTSCDIDVLVHEEDAEKAKSILIEECGYTDHGKGLHDISLFTPANTHIELHFHLAEEGSINAFAEKVLSTAWDTVTLREGSEFWYEMPDEMYYFYHIAHMAKHFETGGCGVRPFIDLWILDGIEQANKGKRDRLLEDGGLQVFSHAARKLSKVWFGQETHDDVTRRMEAYLFHGGVYGNMENRTMVRQQKIGGRTKYALSKFFVPYDTLKFHYPILRKHRWLMPVMEVRRWCKLIFCGHLRRSVDVLKYNRTIDDAKAHETGRLLRDVGLFENTNL